ncbi:MAG: DUF305 domain-containing protein [Nocardioides sp.]|nr:DUF305 domain-containing protein [Nocardioides sp.]
MPASSSAMSRRVTFVATAVLVGLLALVGCGGDEDDASGHNDADVAFAQEMIPHHAQAVQMVRMTQDKVLDPKVAELAEGMAAAQEDEIAQMAEWLEEWGEDVPDSTMQDMGHHADPHAENMPGMMTEEQMGELAVATGPGFQTMWLEMMIEHHEGAIESARTQQEEGRYGPAVELAQEIERSQTEEIAQMEELLQQS